MAKFYGKVGYAHGDAVDDGSGVFVEPIIEKSYYGDVIRSARRLDDAATQQKANKDILVTTTAISVVADEYAFAHFFAIRYVNWQGVNWIVTEVEVQHPRLLLRLGGVHYGPTVSSP